MKESIKGRTHSIETFGAVDGPGLRFILFLQGCPLRCLYCHNRDSWDATKGKEVTVEEVISEILKYKNYIKNGGVTFSGGEPMMQPDFLLALIEECKKHGIHTAIDTSGIMPLSISKNIIDECDMLLLDIKDIDDEDCIKLTGFSNKNMIKTLDYCQSINRRVWIRHVLVKGLTLDLEKCKRLKSFVDKYSCIEKVDLLPFHKIGEYKWEGTDTKYTLKNTKETTKEEMQEMEAIFDVL